MRVDVDLASIKSVYDSLDLGWISIGGFDFLGISEGNVFESVDLTE